MLAIREVEAIESRALGALRFIDAASEMTITTPLRVLAPANAHLIRNRSGLYVIQRYAPLAAHSDSFLQAPATPAIGSVPLTFSVQDPSGAYLGRAVTVQLPRDPAPANFAAANSLFRPIDVRLFRSPASALLANWAPLRVSLHDTDSGDALAGALLRVVNGGNVLARGMTDTRGEALVPVVGIPITTWGDGEDAVIVTHIDATLQVFFAIAAGSVRMSAAQLRADPTLAATFAPDPEAIEASADAVRSDTAVQLAAGRPLALALTVDLSE